MVSDNDLRMRVKTTVVRDLVQAFGVGPDTLVRPSTPVMDGDSEQHGIAPPFAAPSRRRRPHHTVRSFDDCLREFLRTDGAVLCRDLDVVDSLVGHPTHSPDGGADKAPLSDGSGGFARGKGCLAASDLHAMWRMHYEVAQSIWHLPSWVHVAPPGLNGEKHCLLARGVIVIVVFVSCAVSANRDARQQSVEVGNMNDVMKHRNLERT